MDAAAPTPSGPPPHPHASARRGDRTERLAAVVALVSSLLFAGVVGMAHADAQCRDVVETWTSGDSVAVGTTCDEPVDGSDDGEVDGSEGDVPHPDAVAT